MSAMWMLWWKEKSVEELQKKSRADNILSPLRIDPARQNVVFWDWYVRVCQYVIRRTISEIMILKDEWGAMSEIRLDKPSRPWIEDIKEWIVDDVDNWNFHKIWWVLISIKSLLQMIIDWSIQKEQLLNNSVVNWQLRIEWIHLDDERYSANTPFIVSNSSIHNGHYFDFATVDNKMNIIE